MAPPPNVLVIMSDQQNAGWLGCAGHPQVLTPHCDALAAEAVRFEEAWCQNPICTPSRTSIFSGQYPHSHGYYGLSGPAPERLPNLFGHYRRHGYRTAAFGKLHLPDHPVSWLAEDCEELMDLHRGNRGRDPSPYRAYLQALGLEEVEDSRGLTDRRGPDKVAGDHDARPSDMPLEHGVESFVLRHCEHFLQRRDAGPFFLHVSFPRPHHALTPDRRFWDLYQEDLALPASLEAECGHRPPHFRDQVDYLRHRHAWGYEPRDFHAGSRRVWRGTLASVSQNDHFIGRLLGLLRDADLWRNTIVVFTSDHGAYHGLQGIMEKAPGICSREVCRVPLLVRVPGLTEAGGVSHRLVEYIDLAATLPGLCGLPPLATAQGCDLTPLLAGEERGIRRTAVTELPWSKSIRFGDWRFVHYHRRLFDGEDVGELYHVDDPDERRNRYHDPDCAEVVAAARRLLLEWLADSARPRTAWPPPVDEDGHKRFTGLDAGDGREPPGSLARRLQRASGGPGDARCYL